jgi:hypothetical protein
VLWTTLKSDIDAALTDIGDTVNPATGPGAPPTT